MKSPPGARHSNPTGRDLRLKAVAAALLVAMAPSSHGLWLGDPVLRSHLGEPLQVDVPIRADAGELLTEDCLSIGGRNAHVTDGIDFLLRGRVALLDSGRGRSVRITSASPVYDPVVKVRLEASCNNSEKLSRDFVWLLDPPDVAADSNLAANQAGTAQTLTASEVAGLTPDNPLAAQDAGAARATVAQTAPVRAIDAGSAPDAPGSASVDRNGADRDTATSPRPGQHYRLKEGETLADVVAKLVPEGGRKRVRTMRAIIAANADVFATTPANDIAAGTELLIPKLATHRAAAAIPAVRRAPTELAFARELHTSTRMARNVRNSDVPVSLDRGLEPVRLEGGFKFALMLSTPSRTADDRSRTAGGSAARQPTSAKRSADGADSATASLSERSGSTEVPAKLAAADSLALTGRSTATERKGPAPLPAARGTAGDSIGMPDTSSAPARTAAPAAESAMPTAPIAPIHPPYRPLPSVAELSHRAAVVDPARPHKTPTIVGGSKKAAGTGLEQNLGDLAARVTGYSIPLALIGALGAGLLWYRRRRSAATMEFDFEAPPPRFGEPTVAELIAAPMPATAAAPAAATPVSETAIAEAMMAAVSTTTPVTPAPSAPVKAAAPSHSVTLPDDDRRAYLLERFPEIDAGVIDLADADSIVDAARTYFEHDGVADKAIELLEFAIAQDPKREVLWLAQFEIHRRQRRAEAFGRLAERFHAQFVDSIQWPTICQIGRELDPANPLFADLGTFDEFLGSPDATATRNLEGRTDPDNWLNAPLDFTPELLASDLRDSLLADLDELDQMEQTHRVLPVQPVQKPAELATAANLLSAESEILAPLEDSIPPIGTQQPALELAPRVIDFESVDLKNFDTPTTQGDTGARGDEPSAHDTVQPERDRMAVTGKLHLVSRT